MACDYFLIMQCIHLDLDLFTIFFLSFVVSLFLCSDLRLVRLSSSSLWPLSLEWGGAVALD